MGMPLCKPSTHPISCRVELCDVRDVADVHVCVLKADGKRMVISLGVSFVALAS